MHLKNKIGVMLADVHPILVILFKVFVKIIGKMNLKYPKILVSILLNGHLEK